VSQVNILLVDDRQEDLLTLEAILSPLGENLVTARSGEEALRHVLHNDFAVILMDVKMKGLNGFETADLIKQHPKAQHIPIIFLTGFDEADLPAFKTYSLKGVEHVGKPFNPSVLQEKVTSYIAAYRQQ
jgi:CheY-like chemotaxis protein